jgi:DNA polymerase
MNVFSERDAVFLAEMGLTPLWRMRAAAVDADAADAADAAVAVAEDAAVAEAPAVLDAVVQAAPPPQSQPQLQPEPQPQARQAPPPAPAAAPPQRPPLPDLPSGPRPLQPVAQSVSALAPEEAAWDDAALPSDATPEEIAAMDWDQLGVAIAACRRCSACRDGRAPVPGTGSRQARWLVAAGASTAADEKARVPLAGDPGKLLDNMLAAVGLSRQKDVYITNLIKCRPLSPNGAERAPTPEEAAACRPYLERELSLTGAGTVLTLGQIAANTLVGRPLASPLAGLRYAAPGRAAAARRRQGPGLGRPVQGKGSPCGIDLTTTRHISSAAGATCGAHGYGRWPGCWTPPTCSTSTIRTGKDGSPPWGR